MYACRVCDILYWLAVFAALAARAVYELVVILFAQRGVVPFRTHVRKEPLRTLRVRHGRSLWRGVASR